MAELLKNIYTKSYIENLALKISKVYLQFNKQEFISSIFCPLWEEYELKMRMRHIALTLNTFLPFSYKEQLEILKEVSKDFYSYEAMFFQDFVELFGLEDFETSFAALEVFTIDSTSEFAIRAFILKDENKTINQMKLWANSSNEHIRRLASEGCRPRLPWGISLPKFKKDPSKVFQILEILKNDKSKYVQKSVANNLNDISKDNPHLVIEFVSKNLGISKDLDWICKHASRTLLKQAEEKILNLFGYDDSSYINIINFKYDTTLQMGEELNFSFDIQSEKNIGNARIEYAIYYKRANNKHNKKLFMISQNEIKQKTKSFAKKQSFKKLTTRKHYKGKHFISIIINGKEKIKKEFTLL
ncbi:DNA alkylation repair protein [Malaciobacter mytili]|uniref:DNA alkylation repair protein n=1 Tax=Malaciobacter mytili TaxID=603050 RepID=UPI003A8AAC9E